MLKDKLTVAAVNFAPQWGEKGANLERILALAGEAADRGAQIVLFPETALTGYNNDDGSVAMHVRTAEPVPGPASARLAELSRARGIWIVVGLPERDPDTGMIYNSAVVTGPEGLVGCYRKIHLAGQEALWAAKGESALMFDTPWGPVGLGICYDTYCFPELARYFSAHGVRLYLNPTAIPDVPDWGELYYPTLKARVLENGFFVVSANLAGPDRGIAFPGASLVMGPGVDTLAPRILAGPAGTDEEILLAEIELSEAERMRSLIPIHATNPLTGTPDWRPAVYGRMLDEVRALEGWRDSR